MTMANQIIMVVNFLTQTVPTFGTDRLGRIKGIINVHIMDSSVLPTINTGPITGTIMANSFRITEEIFKKTD